MGIKESDRVAPSSRSRQSGALIALAAFALVLVVGTSASLLTMRGGGTNPVAPAAEVEIWHEDAKVAAVENMIVEFYSTDFDVAIGARVDTNCHYISDTDRVRCDIAYTDDFYIVQQDPDITIRWFSGLPDSIIVLDEDLPADTELRGLVDE